MGSYRLTKSDLLQTIKAWVTFIKKPVRLVACGGTAMTLLNVKTSTKDVDFMVPDFNEYAYLIKILGQLGYKEAQEIWGLQRTGEPYIFQFFKGNKIHTTELLHSPLEEGKSTVLEVLGKIEIRVLNYYDLISSKLMRGSSVDFEDCLLLLERKTTEIDVEFLERHYAELVKYDIAEERIVKHFDSFKLRLRKRGLL